MIVCVYFPSLECSHRVQWHSLVWLVLATDIGLCRWGVLGPEGTLCSVVEKQTEVVVAHEGGRETVATERRCSTVKRTRKCSADMTKEVFMTVSTFFLVVECPQPAPLLLSFGLDAEGSQRLCFGPIEEKGSVTSPRFN